MFILKIRNKAGMYTHHLQTGQLFMPCHRRGYKFILVLGIPLQFSSLKQRFRGIRDCCARAPNHAPTPSSGLRVSSRFAGCQVTGGKRALERKRSRFLAAVASSCLRLPFAKYCLHSGSSLIERWAEGVTDNGGKSKGKKRRGSRRPVFPLGGNLSCSRPYLFMIPCSVSRLVTIPRLLHASSEASWWNGFYLRLFCCTSIFRINSTKIRETCPEGCKGNLRKGSWVACLSDLSFMNAPCDSLIVI